MPSLFLLVGSFLNEVEPQTRIKTKNQKHLAPRRKDAKEIRKYLKGRGFKLKNRLRFSLRLGDFARKLVFPLLSKLDSNFKR